MRKRKGFGGQDAAVVTGRGGTGRLSCWGPLSLVPGGVSSCLRRKSGGSAPPLSSREAFRFGVSVSLPGKGSVFVS